MRNCAGKNTVDFRSLEPSDCSLSTTLNINAEGVNQGDRVAQMGTGRKNPKLALTFRPLIVYVKTSQLLNLQKLEVPTVARN